jgi:glutaredoxin
MKPTLLVVAALSFALVAGAQAAKLYKWVDKDGNVTYQSTPPPDHPAEEKDFNTGPSAATDTAPRPAVVLYIAPKCSACDLARAYLDKRKVPYTLKNADSDLAVQEELKNKSGGLSVPTIIVGDKVMRGYVESLLEGELDAAGYPKTEAAGEAEPGPAGEGADSERKYQAPTE